MSTSLYWRPPPPNPDGEHLGSQLKFILGRLLWDHDGSLRSDWTEIGEEMFPYLDGALAAAPLNEELVREVNELRSLIDKYGRIEVCTRN